MTTCTQQPKGESGPLCSKIPCELECLAKLEQITIEQKVKLNEVLPNWPSKSKYGLYDTNGQLLFYACEDLDDCWKRYCGASRGFTIHLVDSHQKELARITRKTTFCGGCGSNGETIVESPPGHIIGRVKQSSPLVGHDFRVEMEDGTIYQIEGPKDLDVTFKVSLCDKIFKVLTENGEEIGEIWKNYSGLVREIFTNANHFTVNCPADLDVRAKTALIGATFLIDFLCFAAKR